MKFLSKLSRTQKWLLGILVVIIIGVSFYYIGKMSIKKSLESQLADIDNRMSSGRASASELVDLRLRKKAIIQQYLNSL